MISLTEAHSMTTYRAGSNALIGAVSRIRGAVPNPVYTSGSPASNVTWSDNGAGGTFNLSGANNSVASYIPKNKTQVITVTASDTTNSMTLPLTVTATIPLHPNVNFEVETDQETKIAFARDRTRYFREDGAEELSWVLGWDNRQRDAVTELRQFWRDHRKVVQFYMLDAESDILNRVWFTSSVKHVPAGGNKFSMAASVRGIDENVAASLAAPLVLRINCGALDVAPYVSDRYFTNGFTFFDPATPDVSGVTSPPPNAVLQSCRYDAFYVEYIIQDLRRNYPYDVRLYWCIASTRSVQVVIQGVVKPSVSVAAGNVATARLYPAINSDNDGKINIRCDNLAGTNTILNAIDIIED